VLPVSHVSHLDPSVLHRLTATQPYHQHGDVLPFHRHAGTMPTSKHYLLPEDHRRRQARVVGGPVCYDGKKLSGGSTTLKCEDGVMRRGGDRTSLSAYYSLGQSAAAAAASQLLFVKAPRHFNTSLVADVHQTYLPPRPRRHVDSRTLRKVCQGQFGVLSTLRSYCSQLRRHSEPTEQLSVVDDNSEVAMDLSVRKSSSSSDVAAGGRYRSSRSCGSSPNVRLVQKTFNN